MTHPRLKYIVPFLLALIVLVSCSDDEDGLRPPPGPSSVMNVRYSNARVIEVNSAAHQALLLHDRFASSGTAIELVDLNTRSVIDSHIFVDYLDLYDIKFISASEGCLAGRPHGHIGYAVQFFSLPGLNLGPRVLVTSDTSGTPGFLAVDSLGGFVYYSHAGGGERDGIFKMRVSDKTIVDADNDGAAPFAMDNDLVFQMFSSPARLFYDRQADRLVVANATGSYVTMIDASIWGTLDRSQNHLFPIPGTSSLTLTGTMGRDRAATMAYGHGVYVFAGLIGSEQSLGRFTSGSAALDLLAPVAGVTWRLERATMRVHPREDVVSVFVVQQDTSGIGIGQYNLNNLQPTTTPYHTRYIADSTVSAFGIDVVDDRLIVADRASARLEFIEIE